MNQVQRRRLLIAAGALLAVPLVAYGQQAAKIARIGDLSAGLASGRQLRDAFVRGLRDVGYVEDRTVAIAYLDTEGDCERLPALAAELVALKVNVHVRGRRQRACSGGRGDPL